MMKFIINLDEVFAKISIPDYFEMIQGNQIAIYKIMLHCVADENGAILKDTEAREALSKIGTMADWAQVRSDFVKAFTDALVNPTSARE
jgi:hypothetical protein